MVLNEQKGGRGKEAKVKSHKEENKIKGMFWVGEMGAEEF